MAAATSQTEIFLPARDYHLAATLDSGQVFRWRQNGDSWEGVLGKYFFRLTQKPDGIHAESLSPVADWHFLREFLQSEVELEKILATFPVDNPMHAAVAHCRGLRLLRQDPWECLASFILSSTKQIVQIRQIVALLCERFGEPILQTGPLNQLTHSSAKMLGAFPPLRVGGVSGADGERAGVRCSSNHLWVHGEEANCSVQKQFSFPTASRIAASTESELRECKMGFRAPGLLNAARQIDSGKLDLEKIRRLDYVEARHELMQLHGVGGKIADCVLLFAYGFDSAFPVDVWVERALQELYFSKRRANDKRLRKFAATHFGPHSGYAQQYLFHYIRTRNT
jgi:N-glycosylase/DNA lyase